MKVSKINHLNKSYNIIIYFLTFILLLGTIILFIVKNNLLYVIFILIELILAIFIIKYNFGKININNEIIHINIAYLFKDNRYILKKNYNVNFDKIYLILIDGENIKIYTKEEVIIVRRIFIPDEFYDYINKKKIKILKNDNKFNQIKILLDKIIFFPYYQ